MAGLYRANAVQLLCVLKFHPLDKTKQELQSPHGKRRKENKGIEILHCVFFSVICANCTAFSQAAGQVPLLLLSLCQQAAPLSRVGLALPQLRASSNPYLAGPEKSSIGKKRFTLLLLS